MKLSSTWRWRAFSTPTLSPFGSIVAAALLLCGCPKASTAPAGTDASAVTPTSTASASTANIGTAAATGTSTSTSTAAPGKKALGDIRYLSLGDSLTQGVGAPDPDSGSFPFFLSKNWRAAGCNVELKNPAIAGYTAADIIREELKEIDAFKPNLITLLVGSNDIVANVPPETYRKNVKTILAAAKKSGARVVVFPQNEWFLSPRGPDFGTDLASKRAAFDAIMIEEAKAAGAEFIDLRPLHKTQSAKKFWSDDDIHPTIDVYKTWANEISKTLPHPCK